MITVKGLETKKEVVVSYQELMNTVRSKLKSITFVGYVKDIPSYSGLFMATFNGVVMLNGSSHTWSECNPEFVVEKYVDLEIIVKNKQEVNT